MLESSGRVATDLLAPLLSLLGRARVSPHLVSVFSLVSAILAGYSYVVRGFAFPWTTVLLIALSGFLDVVDGSLARAIGKESKVGAFLDSTFDRISETAMYTGILMGRYVQEYLIMLALSFSLIVSYERARAESLGVSLRGVGIGERAERIIILLIFTALSRVDLAVVIVFLISLITLLHRLIYGIGSLIRIERAT